MNFPGEKGNNFSEAYRFELGRLDRVERDS